MNGNITKETFHFEEVLFYEVILLNWYNNKHDFINVGKGISEKELKVSKERKKSPEAGLPDINRRKPDTKQEKMVDYSEDAVRDWLNQIDENEFLERVRIKRDEMNFHR